MNIEVTGLDVKRGRSIAVRGVSLTAVSGKWLGIVGANGSGKTSLLRAIAGRLDAAGGSIVVDGIDVTHDRPSRARNIGFAPEAAMLPGSLVPGQLFSLLADRPHLEDDHLAPLRTALEITPLLDRRIGTLSSGNRQRVAIYAAFVAATPAGRSSSTSRSTGSIRCVPTS